VHGDFWQEWRQRRNADVHACINAIGVIKNDRIKLGKNYTDLVAGMEAAEEC